MHAYMNIYLEQIAHAHMFIPEESNNELQNEHSHSDKAQPRMHTVEIHFRRLRQIVRIEDGQKSQSHTRYGAGVKEHMDQLNIDVLQAAAKAVQ